MWGVGGRKKPRERQRHTKRKRERVGVIVLVIGSVLEWRAGMGLEGEKKRTSRRLTVLFKGRFGTPKSRGRWTGWPT